MQMIESNRTQLTSLSLPSSALVIDTRGSKDDVMKRLEIEIADLATDMKTQDIHHWRYLTEFLAFWAVEPMPFEEVNGLRKQKSSDAQEGPSLADTASNGTAQQGLTGEIESPLWRDYSSPLFFMDNVASLEEDRAADILKQKIHHFVLEINRLRNNRHVAVADIEKTLSGRSVKEAIVRVIFLTDAERPDSLATTAAYAAHLKKFYAQKTAPNQPPMVNTIALCLNNSGSTTPSADLKELLWNDEWKHLDALILTEDYREDAAWIAGAMQPYLAELLLYVLLIIPTLRIESVTLGPNATPTNTAQLPPSSTDTKQQGTTNPAEKPSGRHISFPPSTFLIGMAAMEHSARWGRRLLDFAIVEQCVEVMQNETDGERPGIRNSVNNWLNRLRGQVKDAIPDKVPGNIIALQGIVQARNAIKPIDKIFTIQHFDLNLGKETVEDLEDYRDDLASTYTVAQHSSSTEFTLQDALDTIPHIQQRLREWESKDPALRKGTPLVNAQLEAQRVLSHPDFFTGANGAVTRAKLQLEELGTTTSHFRTEHEQNPIDLTKRCEQLVENGTRRIEALNEHVNNIPFLAMVLKLKTALSWATFILIIFMSIICTFLGVAWLGHTVIAANSRLALPSLTSVINSVLFPFASLLAIVVLAITIYVARGLLSSRRAAWRVEIIFFISLLIFALIGLIITNLSLASLASDPASLSVISWLSFMPIVGVVAFIFMIISAVIEIWYVTWWYNHLKQERAKIARFLEEEHKSNIDDVSGYIADKITLHLLERAKLVGDKGGPGDYFQRVNQLNRQLRDIRDDAQEQQRIARRRLTMSVSETQLGVNSGTSGRWLNMRIRDELLDMDTLAEGYNQLVGSLDQEKVELKLLAEILLRVMGEEPSAETEAAFRESFIPLGTLEQHNAQILMTTLVAMTLRLSFNATSLHSISPLLQQYDSVADNLTYRPSAMQSLVDNLRRKMRQDLLQPITGKSTKATETEARKLATSALAAWGQMLWEGRDEEISRALSSAGVLRRLEEEGSDVHMVKRLLGLRTSLFGRNFQPGQVVALYMLIPYSSLAHQFSQELNIQRRHIIHFPDVERLVLLYAQPYAGEPLFIADPPSSLPAPPTTAAEPPSPSDTESKPLQPDPASTSTANNSPPAPDAPAQAASNVTITHADQKTSVPLSASPATSSGSSQSDPASTSTANNPPPAPDGLVQDASNVTSTQADQNASAPA